MDTYDDDDDDDVMIYVFQEAHPSSRLGKVREEHGEVLSLSTPFQTHAIFLKKTLPCS
jgi:hypothetical protein